MYVGKHYVHIHVHVGVMPQFKMSNVKNCSLNRRNNVIVKLNIVKTCFAELPSVCREFGICDCTL